MAGVIKAYPDVNASPNEAELITCTAVGNDRALDVNVVASTGGGEDPVGLKNIAGTQINPATEDGNLATIAGDTTSIDGKLVDGNDIGDVTVNNAAGAGAVNIQDGGNEITVDQATHDNLNANVNLQVGDADVTDLNPVPVSDAGGSLTVDQSVHDNFNANANLQVANQDTAITNPVPVANFDTYTIFNDMLKQMKIMNLHLALITDNFIENKDVEV